MLSELASMREILLARGMHEGEFGHGSNDVVRGGEQYLPNAEVPVAWEFSRPRPSLHLTPRSSDVLFTPATLLAGVTSKVLMGHITASSVLARVHLPDQACG